MLSLLSSVSLSVSKSVSVAILSIPIPISTQLYSLHMKLYRLYTHGFLTPVSCLPWPAIALSLPMGRRRLASK